MNTYPPLKTPIDAIVFDCDSTLSRVEGIDELAGTQAVRDEITRLTEQAMSTTGLSVELYQQRLELVRPNRQRLVELGEQYYQQRSPDIEAVLAVLRSLNKALYVISAGVNPSVALFAKRLGFERSAVHAVDIHFDAQGEYLDFDANSPLVERNGKREIITQIKRQHPRVVHIGDGLNDIEAMDLVTRFIGYGGACYRKNIARLSEFYLTEASLLPMLALVLTADEVHRLSADNQRLYQAGLAMIQLQTVNNP